MEIIKIAIVDDSMDWIKIIQRKLVAEDDIIIEWYALSEEDALEKARQFSDTDIILMDIDMNGDRLSGIKSAIQIKQFSPVKIVMLSSITEEESIKLALSVVIEDYIFKDELQELASRIRRVHQGKSILHIASDEINHLKKEQMLSGFSDAVRNVFNLLMSGVSQKEIQDKLEKSPDTIKVQTKKIRENLGVGSIKDAIRKVKTLGIIDMKR